MKLRNIKGSNSINPTERAMLLLKEAQALASKEQYTEALGITDRVLEADPTFAQTYILRGSVYVLMNNMDTAISEIRKGQAIFEKRGDVQEATVMKDFADDLQYSVDSGLWEEELEEERRIAEEEKNY